MYRDCGTDPWILTVQADIHHPAIHGRPNLANNLCLLLSSQGNVPSCTFLIPYKCHLSSLASYASLILHSVLKNLYGFHQMLCT